MAWYGVRWYGMAWGEMVWHGMVRSEMVCDGMVWGVMVWHGMWCDGMALYSVHQSTTESEGEETPSPLTAQGKRPAAPPHAPTAKKRATSAIGSSAAAGPRQVNHHSPSPTHRSSSPAQPSQVQPSLAQPSLAQPSQAQPNPAQPSPAQPCPALLNPIQPNPPTNPGSLGSASLGQLIAAMRRLLHLQPSRRKLLHSTRTRRVTQLVTRN